MSTITKEQILDVLRTVQDPELGKDLVSLNMVGDIAVEDGVVNVTIILTTPACPLKSTIEKDARQAILQIPGVRSVNIKFGSNVSTDDRIAKQLHLDVRNIIAIASGKGGVGKTTVAVNLAVALAKEGARVGILDADINGPNVPIMLGLKNYRVRVKDGKMVPAEAYGVYAISIGFLVDKDVALLWRGPMLHKALQQLFTDVAWPALDYLIVDMPPGTSDIQLSLAQTVPVTGGLIVAMPQEVAIEDARRGLVAFRQLNVPVIGLVENMTGEIFGEGGGEKAALELRVPFLGRIPLDPHVRTGSDEGKPIVIAEPQSPAAMALRELARAVAARVSMINADENAHMGVI